MKSILSLCAFLILFNLKGFSQESVNDYKYVIIPNSFNFLNEPDQYQINSLTKFLFEKYGFTTLMADDEFPEDLTSNRCLGLFADVEKHKGFLKTKLQVHLKDCNNKLVLSSDIGESREKEYDKVYNLALRDAFNSFENLNYNYQPNSNIIAQNTNKSTVTSDDSKAQAEIDRLKMEVEGLREQKLQKEENEKQTLVEKEKKLRQESSETSNESTEKKAKIELKKTLKKETKSDESFPALFANPVENGYNIIDASSKLLYHLIFSGKEDVYIVKGQDAIVYKTNNTWIISTANDSGVTMKTLKVKFN